MEIGTVTIQNFFAVKEAKFNLAKRGLVLIQGKNDDPSADSNGAGKSSLVDAICWCLYGATARGVTADAVVNKDAKKDCEVSVEIVDNKDIYKIVRSRKPNNLTVTRIVDTGHGPGSIEMTLGTSQATQELIEKIIGCSFEVFTAGIYAGQEAMPDLPGMTDKQLKVLIEESSGVSTLTAAYELAKNQRAKVQSDLTSEANAVAFWERRIDTDKTSLDYTANNEKDEETRLKLLVANAQTNLAEKTNAWRIASQDAEKADEQVKKINEAINALAAQAKNIHVERLALDKLTAETRRLERFANQTVFEAQQQKKTWLAAVDALSNVEKRLGETCSHCGQPIKLDLEAATKHAQEVVDAAKVKMLELAQAAKEALEKQKEAEAKEEEFKSSMTDATHIINERNLLQASLMDAEKLLVARQTAKNEYNEAVQALTKATAEAGNNRFTPMRIKAEEQLQLSMDSLDEAKKKVAQLESDLELAKEAEEIFGPSGVRAHILDTVTPFLNDRTSEYLTALSDGTIQATWTTLSKTATGAIREKFSIEVQSNRGAESFAGLSGGEKRKVRLACAMALQDLVATRANKPLSLFIADEVDHALDVSGLERLMTILDKKAKERGTVLVISHNELSAWIDNVITVTKKSGVSTISGATNA